MPKCPFTGQDFPSYESLEVHLDRLNIEFTPLYQRKFPFGTSSLDTNDQTPGVRQHATYRCGQCGATFHYRDLYEEHVMSVHSEPVS